MTTLAEKLHKWSLKELNLVTEGAGAKIPDVQTLQILTKGKNAKIWNYVINHVRSQATVAKVKRTLLLRKQLKEQEENAGYFSDNSINNEKIKESLSQATEKRKYLVRSLSTIEERILNLDLNIRKTKEETFQINQKTALLEHLKQTYDEKNSKLKNHVVRISSYECALNAYQTSKMFEKLAMDLSYDFLFENKALYDENLSRMKDLVIISSNIFKKQFYQDDVNMNTLKENFQKNFVEITKCGLVLTDIVVLLTEMSRFDLQQFTTLNTEKLSVKEYAFKKSKESQANSHLAHLKCNFIFNSLSAKTSKDKIEKYVTKSKAVKNALEKFEIAPSDFDYDAKLALLEIQAENSALIVTNNYLENYLVDIGSKSEAVLKNIKQKKIHSKDNTVIQLFYKNADLTCNLLYAFPQVIQKVNDYLTDLKLFASKELFNLQFPEEKSIEELKECFSSERKQTWDFCKRTKLIKPLFAETYDNQLSIEVCRFLNIQPYQCISVLCEKWTRFKQKLHAEIAANAKMSVINNDINVTEVYFKYLKILEKTEFSIEKSMLALTNGAACSKKNRTLIQEWWNQDAQYISHIEYQGKTLKMWIDILLVLSDFELQNHM